MKIREGIMVPDDFPDDGLDDKDEAEKTDEPEQDDA